MPLILLSLAVVLRIADRAEELDAAAVRDHAELQQRLVGRRAVPMLDTGRRVVDLAGPELAHGPATRLYARAPFLHEQDETARVRVPVRAVARLEASRARNETGFDGHREPDLALPQGRRVGLILRSDLNEPEPRQRDESGAGQGDPTITEQAMLHDIPHEPAHGPALSIEPAFVS